MKKFCFITISVVLIGFYIYLSIPFGYSYNVIGINTGMRLKYQPLTTCLSYDVIIGNQVSHNSKCGFSPAYIINMKRKMNDNLQFIETELKKKYF